MEDFVIDAAKWHIEGDPLPDRMLTRIAESYGALIPFLHAHHLLKDKAFGVDIKDWRQFELRYSDLTEEGYEVIRLCHDKWLKSLDKGKDVKAIHIWEKGLEKFRK
jgi:hypothetical protein